jgi:hypothetical protein
MIRSIALKIAKRLLLFAVDASLKRALPRIYRQLDSELPFWYKAKSTPAQVDDRIADTMRTVMKAPATNDQLELVKLLFDPAEAALHHYLR